MRRLVATAALIVFLAGCSASEDPPSVITTDRPDPSASAQTSVATLAFGGGTGGTVPGGQPDRTCLAAHQSVEVTREVRLGEVTVAGVGWSARSGCCRRHAGGASVTTPWPSSSRRDPGVTSTASRSRGPTALRLVRTSWTSACVVRAAAPDDALISGTMGP